MQKIVLRDITPSKPINTIVKSMELVSERTGIIRHVSSAAFQPHDPFVYSFSVHVCDTSRFHHERYGGRSGGAGLSLEKALAATLGEVIERYCSAFYDKKNLVFGSYTDLKDDVVHPESFVLFSESQYNKLGFLFVRFTEQSRIYWTWGYSLISNREVLVPASLVYLPYHYSKSEEFIGYSTSTGMAAGNTIEEAILTGIYEIVERDAFTIFWLQRMSMPLVKLSKDLEILVQERFGKRSGSWYFVNITTDINIPSFFGLNIGQAEFGIAPAVGSATRLSPKEAILKVITEIGQARPYFRYELGKKKDWEPTDDFSNVEDFEHHAIVYVKKPELLHVFDFFTNRTSGKKISRLEDRSTGRILDDIHLCLDILKNRGYDVIVIDLTTPDVAELGLVAVRVMIPGLIPLHGNHNFPFLGGERLYEIPGVLGYETGRELNPYPHPFP